MTMKEGVLQRTTIRNVQGKDLPSDWAQLAGVAPDQEVDIVIQDRKAAMRRLEKLMEELGKEAAHNGLTEEKLEELLNEIEDERRSERAGT